MYAAGRNRGAVILNRNPNRCSDVFRRRVILNLDPSASARELEICYWLLTIGYWRSPRAPLRFTFHAFTPQVSGFNQSPITAVGYSRPRKGTVGYGRFRFGSRTKEIAAALAP